MGPPGLEVVLRVGPVQVEPDAVGWGREVVRVTLDHGPVKRGCFTLEHRH